MGSGDLARAKAGVKDALTRLKDLEHQNVELVKALQKSFQSVAVESMRQDETLKAVVSILGKAAVEAAIVANREAEAKAQRDRAAEALKQLLDTGAAVPIPGCAPDAIVTGQETSPDGKESGPLTILFNAMTEEARAGLLGQGPGFAFTMASGARFEVSGVYAVVEKEIESSTAPADSSTESSTQELATD